MGLNIFFFLVSSCDLELMSERIEIRSLIHKGEVDKAIQKVKEVCPKVSYIVLKMKIFKTTLKLMIFLI